MGTCVKTAGAMALVMVLCSSAPGQGPADDRAITAAVENTLAADTRISYDLIDVAVDSGTAMLNGRVNDLTAKDRARFLSSTIRGVRAVVNNLIVKTPERADDEIREDIKTVLANDPLFPGTEIKVNVKAGIAVLAGTVASYAEKEAARRASARIRGLRDIIDTIAVQRSLPRPDREIEGEIRARFGYDIWMHPGSIIPAVTDGRVALTGAAGSMYERDRAFLLAWVSGVSAVDISSVSVTWPLPAPKAGPAAVPSDKDIAGAIRDVFRSDPRLAPFKPRVDVSSGVATLSGTVGNLRALQAAQEDTKNITGVTRVISRVRIRPASIPEDDTLAALVKYDLSSDVTLYRYDIAVTALNGVVRLRGTVDTSFDRSIAEEVASGINGVVRVENNLSVLKRWAYKADHLIEEDMAGLMNASIFFAGETISVSARDGIVSLRGTVRSPAVMEKAEETGYKAGAVSILDYLRVRSPARRQGHTP